MEQRRIGGSQRERDVRVATRARPSRSCRSRASAPGANARRGRIARLSTCARHACCRHRGQRHGVRRSAASPASASSEVLLERIEVVGHPREAMQPGSAQRPVRGQPVASGISTPLDPLTVLGRSLEHDEGRGLAASSSRRTSPPRRTSRDTRSRTSPSRTCRRSSRPLRRAPRTRVRLERVRRPAEADRRPCGIADRRRLTRIAGACSSLRVWGPSLVPRPVTGSPSAPNRTLVTVVRRVTGEHDLGEPARTCRRAPPSRAGLRSTIAIAVLDPRAVERRPGGNRRAPDRRPLPLQTGPRATRSRLRSACHRRPASRGQQHRRRRHGRGTRDTCRAVDVAAPRRRPHRRSRATAEQQGNEDGGNTHLPIVHAAASPGGVAEQVPRSLAPCRRPDRPR